ncbi:MAG TPA: AglZ/HisF2 family acetamidino modification protein [Chitinophagaceae bacterium]|nr:AglZ/HisF2 family acetamidino modification protein [Chitinophagaceae bacterium]
MRRVRIIPVLLLNKGGLYKTIKFKNPKYVGDPINAVKIFNEKEADELLLLDYKASVENRKPDYTKIKEIAEEAFMPMAYGGGIKNLEDAKKVFDCGFEKIVLNSILFENISLIEQVANIYGSQSVVGCIDVKKNIFGKYYVYSFSGTKNTSKEPLKWAKEIESKGVGEIILNSIDNDGTWNGYLFDLIKEVAHKINVPMIACGGAGSEEDFRKAVAAGASAVAAGSMFVFQKKEMGVLISFPSSLKITKYT